MNRMRYVTVLAMLVGCGSDPISYSAPVAINLKAKSSDTANGVVSDEKAITSESGNPYAAFVSDARQRLGGRDPAAIEVDRVELFLGAGSVGVSSLGEVFTGNVDVLFEMNDTSNSYPVGSTTIDASASAGPIAFDVVFEDVGLPETDFAKLLGGNFKIVVRGRAASGFEIKGADANLQTTFAFAAFE